MNEWKRGVNQKFELTGNELQNASGDEVGMWPLPATGDASEEGEKEKEEGHHIEGHHWTSHIW